MVVTVRRKRGMEKRCRGYARAYRSRHAAAGTAAAKAVVGSVGRARALLGAIASTRVAAGFDFCFNVVSQDSAFNLND